ASKDDGERLDKIARDVNDAVHNILGDIAKIHGKKVIIGFGLSGSTAGEGNAGKLGNFASGTSGAPAGWAWVGERGPELVRMRGGETVIPSHVARGFASGTSGWDRRAGLHPSRGVVGPR